MLRRRTPERYVCCHTRSWMGHGKSSRAIIVVTCEQGEAIEGIQFVTDDKGKKVDVQIDLARYGKLWEDIHDQLVADSRAHEKSVSFEVVKRRLERRKRQTRA